MKKILALIMALTMMFVGTALGGAFAEEETITIGITIFDYSNNFVGYIRNGIDYYIANEKTGVEYMIVDGENDQATQTERIDTMISRGVDVLAVNPVDTSACETIVNMARDAGIPVVFFNRMPSAEVLASYDQCWYVGTDAVGQGELQAQMVVDAWTNDQENWDTNGDGVCQYVLLMGTAGHSDATDRANGFHDAIAASGLAVEELASEYANWSTADALDIMQTWIGRYGDGIEMVVSGNDAMALGAVEALRSNGLITDEDYVPVIGVNALPEVSELIRSGVMLGSVLTSPYDAARATIDMCINAANGVDVLEGTEWEFSEDKIVRIPDEMITIDNVDIAVDAYKVAD